MVFQSYALFPHLSVAGNIAYGLRVSRFPRRERRRRVEELLELVGLSGYGGRKVHQLSHGERQRVALARALAPEPQVLLLDEPLSALDAALRVQLRRELRGLLKRLSITAVHVTHDQEEALAIADRLGVMRAGRLLEQGPPERLYRAPRDPFVAGFLGRANLWPGRVVELRDENAVAEVAGVRLPARGVGFSQGEEVLVFFRPEDVELGEGPFRARVTSAELVGDRWILQAESFGLPLILYSPHPPPRDGMLQFGFRELPRLLAPSGPKDRAR